MAVTVDQGRHDHRPARIDDSRARLVDLVVRADRLDATVGHRDADAEPQRIGRAVREGGIVQDRAAHVRRRP